MALEILGIRSQALRGHSNLHQRYQITRPPSSIFSQGILHRKKELKLTHVLNQSDRTTAEDGKYKKPTATQSSTICGCGMCNPRKLLGALGSIPSFLCSAKPDSSSSDLISNALEVMNEVHPPRPVWYEKLYAYALIKGTKAYEEEVGEALPVLDSSMDAVVGTIVLCSVSDVRRTLKEVQRVLKPSGRFIFVEHVAAPDGTLLRFWQKLLDPLQQFAADGCHLTRDTGKLIRESGFSKVDINMKSFKTVSLVSPHVFGTAYK